MSHAPTTAPDDVTSLTRLFELFWGRDNPAIEGWREAVESWSEVLSSSVLPVWPWAAARDSQAPAPPEPAPFGSYPPGKTIEQLAVGDSASMTRHITQADIDAFARVSGDDNPAHVDAEWAAATRLGGRVAHGMLTAGLISAVLGTRLPGPGSIYMSQELRWVAPVWPDDVLTATVTVKEIVAEKGRVVLDTVVSRDGEPVLTGQALVMPPPAALSGPRPAKTTAPAVRATARAATPEGTAAKTEAPAKREGTAAKSEGTAKAEGRTRPEGSAKSKGSAANADGTAAKAERSAKPEGSAAKPRARRSTRPAKRPSPKKDD